MLHTTYDGRRWYNVERKTPRKTDKDIKEEILKFCETSPKIEKIYRTRKEIREHVGISRGKLDKLLTKLVNEGLLTVEKQGNDGSTYLYSRTKDQKSSPHIPSYPIMGLIVSEYKPDNSSAHKLNTHFIHGVHGISSEQLQDYHDTYESYLSLKSLNYLSILLLLLIPYL